MPTVGDNGRSAVPGFRSIFRPPEGVFLLIGAGAAAVLAARVGWQAAASREMAGGATVYLLLLLSARRWPVMADGRVRLGINYLCMAWLYGATSRVTAALGSPVWDETLLGADRRLFGETPSVCLQACCAPWLTDVMSACYTFYHLYLHGMLVLVMFTHTSAAARRFGDGLYAGFAVGFVGYLLVPALGPGTAFPSLYGQPLAGGAMSTLNAWIVGKGAAIYGTFPSLHVLVTVILLDHDWRWCRRRFWWVSGPAVGLLASTLYLRYHYAVDLLAGFGVFAVLRATILRKSPPSPMKPADPWTHDAARLPLAFAQVREDPQIDAALLAGLGGKARVAMIASGGDTAALLVARELTAHLHLVDANPAQLALTRLKLALLGQARPSARPELLGHRHLPPDERARGLAILREELSLPETVFGPADFVANVGPDDAGRYEVLFRHLREAAAHRSEIAALMEMDDPAAQARLVAPGTDLRTALDRAFDNVMRLENLVALFGAEATQNPLQDFPRHFAERTFHALANFPARNNPFLAQLLLDPPNDTGFPDWLLAPAPVRWPEIVFTHAPMVDALRALPEAGADFVHLSNILDWLSPEAAAETLALAWRALRPGGVTLIRQLNSSLDIPPLGPRFAWMGGLAGMWHRRDRSFFYRALHVGRK